MSTGRSLAWWLDGGRFLRAPVRAVTSYCIEPEGQGTRLVSRNSADATGPTARLALLVFRLVDSIMACRQLVGLRDRIEHCETDAAPKVPETGDRDQYQLYEILYAGGDRAGVTGKEDGAKWRRSAIRDGILPRRE